jgi:gamma-butyrobetaine dioxygenase
MTDAVDTIAALFAGEGSQDYLGEQVSMAEHMLQAATLAAADQACGALVAAALLHDVGHFTGAVSGRALMEGSDNRHDDTGADWLAQWFGPEVCEPVRLHVAAKRYLCAVDAAYLDELSPASVFTMSVQGGPMDAVEARAFEASPYADDAVAVRRWDDRAKDPAAPTRPFDHFRPTLERLLASTSPPPIGDPRPPAEPQR